MMNRTRKMRRGATLAEVAVVIAVFSIVVVACMAYASQSIGAERANLRNREICIYAENTMNAFRYASDKDELRAVLGEIDPLFAFLNDGGSYAAGDTYTIILLTKADYEMEITSEDGFANSVTFTARNDEKTLYSLTGGR